MTDRAEFLATNLHAIITKYIGELDNEQTFQELKLDLSEHARITGVRYAVERGPRRWDFSVGEGEAEIKFTYEW